MPASIPVRLLAATPAAPGPREEAASAPGTAIALLLLFHQPSDKRPTGLGWAPSWKCNGI